MPCKLLAVPRFTKTASGLAGAYEQKVTVSAIPPVLQAFQRLFDDHKENDRFLCRGFFAKIEPRYAQKNSSKNQNQIKLSALSFLTGQNRNFLRECPRQSLLLAGCK